MLNNNSTYYVLNLRKGDNNKYSIKYISRVGFQVKQGSVFHYKTGKGFSKRYFKLLDQVQKIQCRGFSADQSIFYCIESQFSI